MFRIFKSLLLILCIAILSGCAGLVFQVAPVSFTQPFFQTNFSDLPPNEAESSGVPLVFKIPNAGQLRYVGNIKLFAREEEGKGVKFDFNIIRTEKYTASGNEGDFLEETYHDIDRNGGTIEEKMIRSSRGEIKKFIKGEHRSEMGKFDVMEYKRTPFFPEGLVKVGDNWTSAEEVSYKIRSFWIKQKKPSHKTIVSKSTLKGFTTVALRRVAVIYTESEEQSLEEFSFMFKDIQIDVNTKIEEIIYFDYARGIILRQLTNTLTNSTVLGVGMSDVGKSQTYFYLDEEISDDDGLGGSKTVEAGDGARA